MKKQLFETVRNMRWHQGGERYQFRRTAKHADIYQVLQHLRENPRETCKIPGDGKKQHVVLGYAVRHQMKVQTLCFDGYLYIRLRRPKAKDVQPAKAFQVTTADEWKELRAKRAKSQNERRLAPLNGGEDQATDSGVPGPSPANGGPGKIDRMFELARRAQRLQVGL